MTYVDKRKHKHQNQRIKLPLNTITLLSLSTKGTNNKKVLTYSPFCYKLPKATSIIRGWRRWKRAPIVNKFSS